MITISAISGEFYIWNAEGEYTSLTLWLEWFRLRTGWDCM